MDVLKEIEAQIISIKKVDASTYLDSIFLHIERAEFYYNSGINDSNFFNDVIYRSNQAYEGALKESYKVLAEKSADEVVKKTPNDIEKFFETENIFKDRVLQLFRNYRQEWRNKSTHDYKLFFDESEAFIALTSVTSFVHLLLKQIQEKTAYIAQQKKLELEPGAVKVAEAGSVASNLDVLTFLVSNFAKNVGKDFGDLSEFLEVEILGALHAYLVHSAPDIEVRREVRLGSKSRIFMADFLIDFGGESIILEIKRYKARFNDVESAINQVLQYMEAAVVTSGVLYYVAPLLANEEIKIRKENRRVNDIEYQVVVIGA